MQINEFQKLIEKTYGDKDRKRGIENTWLWFSEEVVDAWEHENESKKNGRPFKYSDVDALKVALHATATTSSAGS